MSWVDKLNRWALGALRPEPVERASINAKGMSLIHSSGTSRTISWLQIQEIAVVRQPTLATGNFALAIRAKDSELFIVDDSVEGFAGLCEQLPRNLPGVIPYATWATMLTAHPEQTGYVIFTSLNAPATNRDA